MTARDVLVVRTGTANLASVIAGLTRIGLQPQVTSDPDQVARAGRVVLPGVGSLAPAMSRLRSSGLVEAMIQRVSRGLPTLAVCLGLQLLCDESDESPGVAGLGILPARVERFPSTVVVPQMGWNRVEPADGCRLLRRGHAYFANSYRITSVPSGWAAALSSHGGTYVAALERENILACQFHPELSGRWGLDLLDRWAGAAGGGSC
jgi:imidazole glycerol phosphate synthase glutamine amidotransferase subunit